ncbi:MAG TPA: class I tRNA ligase family protein, partial [Candidatus Nanoarchaeia archaeon]|nr:class I tRNA ligase family protein [Candidatus Nanoarchaeia archaeon]
KGIFVNWWVTGKGGKISKSKGGAEPIPEAIQKYGVDAMRFYYAHIGSPHVDVVWTEDIVLNYKNALERIYTLVQELQKADGARKTIDDWLQSRINRHLVKINKDMESYNLRELASTVYYNIHEDLKWYLRRGGENKKCISAVLSIWTRLMNPITPHLSEELNLSTELMSASSWPEADQKKISLEADASEELIKTTMEGIRNVLKLTKLDKAQKCTLFVAEPWLYDLFRILSKEINVTRSVGEIMRRVLEEEQMKLKGKEVSRIVQAVVKDVSKLPAFVTTPEEEVKVLREGKEFLEKEFQCEIKLVPAPESGHEKARAAMPGKPGILVE